MIYGIITVDTGKAIPYGCVRTNFIVFFSIGNSPVLLLVYLVQYRPTNNK